MVEIALFLALMFLGVLDFKYGKVSNKYLFSFISLCIADYIIQFDVNAVDNRYIGFKIFFIVALLYTYIKKGNIGGADIKVLIGLALVMDVFKFIELIIFSCVSALLCMGVFKIITKEIEAIRFIPFIAGGYFLIEILI